MEPKSLTICFFYAARSEPSWQRLSALLNCEYQLFVLNQDTPLRHNPFLSHWVEAIQRAANQSTRSQQHATNRSDTERGLGKEDVHTVRVGFIKELLQSLDSSQFARLTPETLYMKYVGTQKEKVAFDINTYIRILEDEGIYERATPATPSPSTTSDQQSERSTPSTQQWRKSLLSRLETHPESTIQELTHLPIDLPTLDLLTTLLQEKTLQKLSIDPTNTIRSYLQHALRTLESMSQPPNPISPTTEHAPNRHTNNDNNANDLTADPTLSHEQQQQQQLHQPPTERSRPAQIRAIKLLLLFMRNLIRKALIPPEDLYFEIQEICVRYVWVKEVREFRDFVERGEG